MKPYNSQGNVHSLKYKYILQTADPYRMISLSGQFILQTADPYRMTRLSAVPCDVDDQNIQEK